MHDWTILSVFIDWVVGKVVFEFKDNHSELVLLEADGFFNINVPRRNEWGESVSVNEVIGPLMLENGNFYISLEIQSGDKIEVEARSIDFRKGP